MGRKATDEGNTRTRRWLIVALLVVTAFIAAPSFASADSGSGTPTIGTDRLSYEPGATVDLSGSGFAPGDTVTLTIADAFGWTSAASATVAADGTFTGALIALPSTFDSNLTATAIDTTSGDTASVPVIETTPGPSFTPTVTTDQADYAPGSVVTITGSGWSAGDSVSVATNAGDNSWSQTDQVTTDASGDFTDQVTLPLMSVATYTVTVSDANGLSATTTFTDSTSTSLSGTMSPTTINLGQSATVSGQLAANSAGLNGGTITLDSYSSASCATGQLVATVGTTTTATINSTAGSYSINFTPTATTTLHYEANFVAQTIGGINYSKSSSACLALTVNPTASTSTGLALHTGTNPSTYGDSLTFRATVSPVPPSGTVEFKDGGTDISGCAALTVSSGIADCTTSALGASTTAHSITAVYSGTPGFNGSTSSALSQMVNKASSTTAVTCGAGPFTYNGSAQAPCSVSVTGAGGLSLTPTPTYSNNTNAGTATASYTYAGDTNHTGSSDSKNFTISKATPTVNLTWLDSTYTGNPHPASATVTGTTTDGQIDASPDSLITFSYYSGPTATGTPLAAAPTDAGTYTAVAHYSGSSNYTSADSSPTTITISKATVHVDANPASKTYGQTDPLPGHTLRATDFESGDTAGTSNITGSPTCTIGSHSENAGTYHVISCIPNTLAAPNYTFVAGSTADLTINQATLTVAADNKAITYGDSLPTFTYQVTGFTNGDPSTILTGSATCASSGTTGTPPGPANTYSIKCTQNTLNAGVNYEFSFTSGTLTISKKQATLGYTGGMFFSTGSTSATTANVALQATLTPASGGAPDLTNAAPPVFRLYKSTNLTMTTPDATCAATSVSSSGIATCTMSSLAIDNWTVVVNEPTNGYFTAPNSDPAVVTVYQPSTSQFATGGGWIVDPGLNSAPVGVSTANPHGNFGFSVKYKSGTTPQGQAVYVFRGSDGYDYVIKSNSWSGGGLSFTTDSVSTDPYYNASLVSFSGKCNINVINPANGQVVSSTGNDTFRVDATDGSAIGKPDKYAITVYTGSGTIYHQAAMAPTSGPWNGNTASPSSQLTLGGGGNGGGNLTVHIK